MLDSKTVDVYYMRRDLDKGDLPTSFSLWKISTLNNPSVQFSSVTVVSDSLQPHELQHARPPCPSPTPAVHSDSRPSSQWCHPAISSSVIPFSSCPQSLPGSESFPMSQLFAWGGQSTGVSALAIVVLIVVWICISLMTNDVARVFMFSLPTYVREEKRFSQPS